MVKRAIAVNLEQFTVDLQHQHISQLGDLVYASWSSYILEQCCHTPDIQTLTSGSLIDTRDNPGRLYEFSPLF